MGASAFDIILFAECTKELNILRRKTLKNGDVSADKGNHAMRFIISSRLLNGERHIARNTYDNKVVKN